MDHGHDNTGPKEERKDKSQLHTEPASNALGGLGPPPAPHPRRQTSACRVEHIYRTKAQSSKALFDLWTIKGEHHKSGIIYSLACWQRFLNISFKLFHNFSSYFTGQTNKQTGRQTDKPTNKQTDRQPAAAAAAVSHHSPIRWTSCYEYRGRNTCGSRSDQPVLQVILSQPQAASTQVSLPPAWFSFWLPGSYCLCCISSTGVSPQVSEEQTGWAGFSPV